MATPLSRREFLQMTGGLVAVAGTSPLWLRLGPAWSDPGAGAPGRRKLLVVFLAGGNDGLNTVVPYGMGDYYAMRGSLAVPAEAALKLSDSDTIGLNPNLPTLAGLYDQRKVAVVQGVGYDKPDLSHFTSMDIWQCGSPTRAFSSGWLGRYLDRSPGPEGSVIRAVAIGNDLPLALVGDSESGVSMPSFGGFTFYDGKDTDPASEPYRLHEAVLACAHADLVGAPAQTLTGSQRKMVTAVRAVNAMADPKEPPPQTLADRVGMALKLLNSNLGVEIAFVTLGGFDTHAAQDSLHPKLLAELDAAVARFSTDVATYADPGSYLLMTFSEFGRRPETVSGPGVGTDHGTAAPLFVVGDGVTGGLYGEHPRLDAAGLDDNKNLVRTVDFREVYATILDRWLGDGAMSEDVLRLSGGNGLHAVQFLP
jgi:uncharacterized protein (DUF1501 family)